jgi:putative transcription factor
MVSRAVAAAMPAAAQPACEMCGKEAPLRTTIIEGTRMQVCPNCAKFGVEVAGQKTEVTGRSRVTQAIEQRSARAQPRDIFQAMELDLVEDFGKRIREARQRKGLTQEELAQKLAERQSVLSKVEAGTQRPNDDLARRIERALDIKLFEPVAAAADTGPKAASASGFTLGDLIKRKGNE